MRKKIFGLAIIAISLFAANGIAQTPSSAPAGRPDKTKVQKCDRKEKCQRNLFEGLNLTADQQQKLQQLDSKRKADRKSEAKEMKQKKQFNDSVRRADRRAAKKAYLEEVKAIVGPDKYVLFLENMVINGGDHHKAKAFKGHGKDFKAKGNHKGHRSHHRPDRIAGAAAKTSASNS